MIEAICACGHQTAVPEEFAGGRVRCRECGTILDVPDPIRGAPTGTWPVTDAAMPGSPGATEPLLREMLEWDDKIYKILYRIYRLLYALVVVLVYIPLTLLALYLIIVFIMLASSK